MNENLVEFFKDLDLNTAITMSNEQISSREVAFTTYVLSQIATKVGADNYEVVHASLKSNDGKCLGEIFAYNESANQEVLTLFYTIYDSSSTGETKVLTDSDIQYAWNRLQGFYERSIRGAYYDLDEQDPAYDISKIIDDHKNTYQTIRFYVLSNYCIKRSEPKKYRIRSKETDSNVWDLKKLAGNLTNTADHVEINIDFANDPDYNMYKIPYILMTPDEQGYRCMLMMFPAKLLYKLYKKWNTDLLMYNVRYWLTFKKTKKKHTNADIRETLRNEKSMFLAYNNGLTAIATNVNLEEYNEKTVVGESDGDYISNDFVSMGILKGIKNFQIVNGGQTTASIFKAKDSEGSISLNGAFVQVKLIVISENQNINELASKISKSSNSQNAVKDSDFSVSEQFNTKMQELSRSIKIPSDKGEISYWFYERIRGQYEEEKSRCRKKEDAEVFMSKFPKELRFTKESMAIARLAWKQEPYDAVKGAGTTYDMFISSIIDSGFVPDDVFYKETIALLIINNFLKARPENKSYKNAKASVITYAMAYLHYITFDTLNLLDIWEKQRLTNEQMKGLNYICEDVFAVLNELASAEETTVLSYGKRKNAFHDLCTKMPAEGLDELRKLILS